MLIILFPIRRRKLKPLEHPILLKFCISSDLGNLVYKIPAYNEMFVVRLESPGRY